MSGVRPFVLYCVYCLFVCLPKGLVCNIWQQKMVNCVKLIPSFQKKKKIFINPTQWGNLEKVMSEASVLPLLVTLFSTAMIIAIMSKSKTRIDLFFKKEHNDKTISLHV